ncbi:hypothetical protein SLEP1_g15513 [Rubroshorea leprosula]|uniref:Protein POLAR LOCALIZATION DURING ASYMMETRIC DIVISION AND REDISTRIBUTION-like n=1 Tax=Rubroshorea leprosula TaxID=152421 RepID=A0AAV5IZA2_9ROSI|nr:hypothetical protein SLEP1_g15513 [Rubroshorea leprosula]
MRSGDGYSGVGSESLLRIVGRLLARLWRSNRSGEKRIGRRNDGVAQVDGSDSRVSSSLGPAIDPSSERCRRETSLNLGIGGSLLYLMAASKIEMNKMVELRIQMETILQNVKEELQRKNAFFNIPPPPETNEMFKYSAVPDSAEENTQLSTQIPPPSNTVLSDQCLESDMAKSEDCFEGMNQLEAELKMELERLQLCLDAEKGLGNPPQGSMMVNEDNTSVRTNSFSFSEVIDPGNDIPEECFEEQCGIPPFELERKLHELLEARQQEQIRELEAALECTKQKLREKETEISWWKDTAHLLSQHVSESSCRPFPTLH